MIDALKKDAEGRMKKALDALQQELTKLRTGRAHPSLLDHVMVSYYGNDAPLKQVATLTTLDARTLQVTPFEKSLIPAIEKAIMSANLGLNPVTAGTIIRVPLPPLTEERRKDMIKLVKAEGEKSKVAVRNVRRDANTDVKELQKKKQLSEDEERRASDILQKLTDQMIAEIDKVIASKEKDLMSF